MNKSFDCVEMKHRAQRRLLEEYERRKSEFSSYADFIRKTVNDCPEIREWRATLAKGIVKQGGSRSVATKPPVSREP